MKAKTIIGGSLLVAFLFFLAAPGLNSAEKRFFKFDPMRLLMKPFIFVTSFIPIFGPSLTTDSAKTNPNSSRGKVKPTGDSTASRPSIGD